MRILQKIFIPFFISTKLLSLCCLPTISLSKEIREYLNFAQSKPIIPGLMEIQETTTMGDEGSEGRFSLPPPPPIRENVPRIAILLPLTGTHAKLGNALLNASKLALFHFHNKDFELLPQDTRGTPSGAAEAARMAVSDGASLILGPLFSDSVKAATEIANNTNVSILSFSNNRGVSTSKVFTMGLWPGEEVNRIIKYAMTKGNKKFALLAPKNQYGFIIKDEMEKTLKGAGLEIYNVAFFNPLETDFGPKSWTGEIVKALTAFNLRKDRLAEQKSVLKDRGDEKAKARLKRLNNMQTYGDLPFDALLVPAGGERLRALAALLSYFDVDPKKTQLLGTSLWDFETANSEPMLIGGWYSAPPKEDRKLFIKDYTEMFGEGPPPRLASLAYDATAIAAVFVQEDGSFDPRHLVTRQGFGGKDGIFRFTKSGFAQRGLAVYQVLGTGNKTLDQAPKTFKDN